MRSPLYFFAGYRIIGTSYRLYLQHGDEVYKLSQQRDQTLGDGAYTNGTEEYLNKHPTDWCAYTTREAERDTRRGTGTCKSIEFGMRCCPNTCQHVPSNPESQFDISWVHASKSLAVDKLFEHGFDPTWFDCTPACSRRVASINGGIDPGGDPMSTRYVHRRHTTACWSCYPPHITKTRSLKAGSCNEFSSQPARERARRVMKEKAEEAAKEQGEEQDAVSGASSFGMLRPDMYQASAAGSCSYNVHGMSQRIPPSAPSSLAAPFHSPQYQAGPQAFAKPPIGASDRYLQDTRGGLVGQRDSMWFANAAYPTSHGMPYVPSGVDTGSSLLRNLPYTDHSSNTGYPAPFPSADFPAQPPPGVAPSGYVPVSSQGIVPPGHNAGPGYPASLDQSYGPTPYNPGTLPTTSAEHSQSVF